MQSLSSEPSLDPLVTPQESHQLYTETKCSVHTVVHIPQGILLLTLTYRWEAEIEIPLIKDTKPHAWPNSYYFIDDLKILHVNGHNFPCHVGKDIDFYVFLDI